VEPPVAMYDEDDPYSLLPPAYRPLCEQYKKMYAEILARWGELEKRAEVLKFVEISDAKQRRMRIDIVLQCDQCGQPLAGAGPDLPICPKCRRLPFHCVVCHTPVRGLSNFCLSCGHGGHVEHMQQWFAEEEVCPTGCGCNCVAQANLVAVDYSPALV